MSNAFFWLQIIIYEVLLTFRENLLVLSKLSTPTSSLFTVANTVNVTVGCKTVVSSAITKAHLDRDLCMSLIYKRKSTGPNTEPCGTHNLMFDVEELEFLTETYCFLLLKSDLNQLCMTPLVPLCWSLLINMSWLTVSNAFQKSRYTAMVLCFLSNDE